MTDIKEIKAAALAVTGWKLDHAWLDTSEDESSAVVGHIDEDGNEYAVITVDCDQYFQGQDSLPLAKYYAQANPPAVLELITRLEAAEKEVSRLEWIISLHPAIDSSVIGQKSVLAEWLDIKLGEPVAWACVTEEGDCEQIDYGTESPLPGDAGFFPLFKKPELK